MIRLSSSCPSWLRVHEFFPVLQSVIRKCLTRSHEGHEEDRRDQGFTLLEVLVSFAVAGLVVAIVIPASLLARQRLRSAEAQWQATQMASALIDTMVASGKAMQPQVIGDWQASGTLKYIDTQDRTRVRLARVEVKLASLNDTQAEPVMRASVRLVAAKP